MHSMQDQDRFRLAEHLRLVLWSLLAALIVLNLLGAWNGVRSNVARLEHWPRHSALVAATAGGVIELEIATVLAESIPGHQVPEHATAYEPHNTRILLPPDPYTWYSLHEEVELVQDPHNPGFVQVLNPLGMWLPELGRALLVLLFLAAIAALRRARWGEDQSWSDGGWVVTAQPSIAPGARADPAHAITEPRHNHRSLPRWTVLFGLSTLLALAWLVLEQSPAATGAALLAAALLALSAHAWLRRFSRTIGHDESGLVETTFFGARRVAWQHIGSALRVNINELAQQRYDQAPIRKRAGTRPGILYRYEVRDRAGALIFRWNPDLQSPLAFEQMINRANQGKIDLSPAARRESREQRHAESERRYREFELQQKRLPPLPAQSSPIGFFSIVLLVLCLSPFVLGTAYMSYRSLWFEWLATHTEGTVRAVNTEDVPSLRVEYFDREGQSHLIESNGSDFYLDYARGDAVTVMFDPQQPEDARLDLFLENWLMVLIMAVLTALVCLGCYLPMRALRTQQKITPALAEDEDSTE